MLVDAAGVACLLTAGEASIVEGKEMGRPGRRACRRVSCVVECRRGEIFDRGRTGELGSDSAWTRHLLEI
jgi:hypothetical protein